MKITRVKYRNSVQLFLLPSKNFDKVLEKMSRKEMKVHLDWCYGYFIGYNVDNILENRGEKK